MLLDSSDEENCFKTEIPQITSHASEKTFPAIESQSTSEMVQNLQASLAENDNSNMTRNSLITNYFRPANSDNSTDMEASEISRTSTTVTSLGMEEVKSDHNPDRSDLIIGATSAVIREEGIKKEPSADTEYVPVLEEMPMVSNATITNEEQPVVWIKIERENRNGPDTVRDNALILKEMVSNATSPSNELPVVRVMPKVSNNINTSKEQSVVRIKIEPNNKTNSDASTESGDATSTAEEQPVLRIKIERENETDSNAQDYCIWGSNGT